MSMSLLANMNEQLSSWTFNEQHISGEVVLFFWSSSENAAMKELLKSGQNKMVSFLWTTVYYIVLYVAPWWLFIDTERDDLEWPWINILR